MSFILEMYAGADTQLVHELPQSLATGCSAADHQEVCRRMLSRDQRRGAQKIGMVLHRMIAGQQTDEWGSEVDAEFPAQSGASNRARLERIGVHAIWNEHPSLGEHADRAREIVLQPWNLVVVLRLPLSRCSHHLP